MFTKTDDPIADYNRYEAGRNKKLARRPKCMLCGEHIQSETAVYIEGEYICDDCIEENKQFIEVE